MSTDTSRPNPYTRGMAAYVADLAYERVPAAVIDRLKLLILDAFGCAIFGTRLEWSRILMTTLAGIDSSSSCAVWGTRRRLSAPHAALVNGTLVQSFELDDVHRNGVLHVGAVTLAPVLAVVELYPGMNGRDFLTAALAGYEIGPRVGLCMGPEHIGQGWHSGATLGVFSAAASAAAALRLPVDKVVHALGIAGTQASGLMAAQYGSMVKRMHAGRSAQSGLYAALLAQAGFTGIVDIFESRYGGFCSTFSASHDRFNLAELTAELGSVFETMGVALKFYSCVGSNHTTLDAIREIQHRCHFAAGDVDKIIVHASQVTLDHVGWPYRPQDLTSAQLNLSYCVATLLIEGDVFVEQFSDSLVADPQRIALAERIEVRHDPSITARGAKFRHMVRVEVFLTDGSHHEVTVEAPRGSERNFASEAEIVAKFHKLTRDVLGTTRADQIVDLVLNCQKQADIGVLSAALAIDN